MLVPAPGSAPLRSPADHWGPRRICEIFVEEGLAGHHANILARSTAVPKSATAPPGKRPTAESHYNSMTCRSDIQWTGDIVVIDDVITAGRTLLAAISRVQEVYPMSRVRGFAVLRTMSEGEITNITEPVEGKIETYQSDHVARRP
jgi:hypothetical protein